MLNERQIKLLMAFCANGIQHAKGPDLRIKKIIELRGRLEETVPNWMQLIKEELSDSKRPEASEAFAAYLKLEPSEQYPPPRSPLIFKVELAPFYRPLEEVERDCKELNARLVDYALAMIMVDELYTRGGLMTRITILSQKYMAFIMAFPKKRQFFIGKGLQKEKRNPRTIRNSSPSVNRIDHTQSVTKNTGQNTRRKRILSNVKDHTKGFTLRCGLSFVPPLEECRS